MFIRIYKKRFNYYYKYDDLIYMTNIFLIPNNTKIW